MNTDITEPIPIDQEFEVKYFQDNNHCFAYVTKHPPNVMHQIVVLPSCM